VWIYLIGRVRIIIYLSEQIDFLVSFLELFSWNALTNNALNLSQCHFYCEPRRHLHLLIQSLLLGRHIDAILLVLKVDQTCYA
jgi:hypothetical protein